MSLKKERIEGEKENGMSDRVLFQRVANGIEILQSLSLFWSQTEGAKNLYFLLLRK